MFATPASELGASAAPPALVYQAATGKPPDPNAGIAPFAGINGALIQSTLAYGVLYGLAAQGALPAVPGRANSRTRPC